MELMTNQILYILGFIALLSGIIFQKNRIVSICIIVFLFILFGWSYGNADYNAYIGLFNNSPYDPIIETGFQYLNYFFRSIGLTYRELLIFISAITMGVYYAFVSSKTKYVALVLALYFIFPFPMETVQVRFTVATMLVYLGLFFLLSKNNWGIIPFVVLTLLAATMHTSAILLLLLIPLIKMKTHYALIFALIFTVLVAIPVNNLQLFNDFFNSIKLGNIANIIAKVQQVNANTDIYNDVFMIYDACIITIYFAVYFYIYYYIKHNFNQEQINQHNKKINYINTCFKINFLLIILLPLFNITFDFFRFIEVITLINLTGLTSFLDIKDEINPSASFIDKLNDFSLYPIYLGLFLLIFVENKFFIVDNYNYQIVNIPLFENNQLIEWIKALFGIA